MSCSLTWRWTGGVRGHSQTEKAKRASEKLITDSVFLLTHRPHHDTLLACYNHYSTTFTYCRRWWLYFVIYSQGTDACLWQIVQHTDYNTYYTYYNYYSQTSIVTLLSDSAICTSISQQGRESGSHLADNWVGWLRNLPCGAGVLWPDWWRTHQTALLALATSHRTAPVWKRKNNFIYIVYTTYCIWLDVS